jgi:hypothetical protein
MKLKREGVTMDRSNKQSEISKYVGLLSRESAEELLNKIDADIPYIFRHSANSSGLILSMKNFPGLSGIQHIELDIIKNNSVLPLNFKDFNHEAITFCRNYVKHFLSYEKFHSSQRYQGTMNGSEVEKLLNKMSDKVPYLFRYSATRKRLMLDIKNLDLGDPNLPDHNNTIHISLKDFDPNDASQLKSALIDARMLIANVLSDAYSVTQLRPMLGLEASKQLHLDEGSGGKNKSPHSETNNNQVSEKTAHRYCTDQENEFYFGTQNLYLGEQPAKKMPGEKIDQSSIKNDNQKRYFVSLSSQGATDILNDVQAKHPYLFRYSETVPNTPELILSIKNFPGLLSGDIKHITMHNITLSQDQNQIRDAVKIAYNYVECFLSYEESNYSRQELYIGIKDGSEAKELLDQMAGTRYLFRYSKSQGSLVLSIKNLYPNNSEDAEIEHIILGKVNLEDKEQFENALLEGYMLIANILCNRSSPERLKALIDRQQQPSTNENYKIQLDSRHITKKNVSTSDTDNKQSRTCVTMKK